MSWAVGFDPNWKRDIGYGVPAYCDHPQCWAEIDRGLAYVCGGKPFGGEKGCGLFFCPHHLDHRRSVQMCLRCARYEYTPYKPKEDHPTWIDHKATHPSWAAWRAEQAAEQGATA